MEDGGAVLAAVVTDTMYGTADVVSLTNQSSSVLGRTSEPPPAYTRQDCGVVFILSLITLEKSPQFIKDDHLLMPCLLNLNF